MMDIDKLEAGRELDALVAENVMGWAVNGDVYATEAVTMTEAWKPLPGFSTDIAAVQDVIKTVLASFAQPGLDGRFSGGDVRLRQHGWRRGTEDVGYGNWGCLFTKRYSDKPKEWHGAAEDLSLAICRAALKVYLEPQD